MYEIFQNQEENHRLLKGRSSRLEVYCKTGILKNFASLLFDKVDSYKKKTATPVFSCELCEILKNTYFEELLRAIASEKGDSQCQK